jgi:hypothetical protein
MFLGKFSQKWSFRFHGWAFKSDIFKNGWFVEEGARSIIIEAIGVVFRTASHANPGAISKQ